MSLLKAANVVGVRRFVDAFWCLFPALSNVGDQLTPWLINRIAGLPARWVPAHSGGRRVIAAGSVAALATRGAVLWGTGVMNRDDRIQPGVQITAVRGPLTREAAQRSKVPCPPVFGDPGLLVPRLLPCRRVSCNEAGLVPHFSNLADARLPAGWRLVDVRESVEVFVDQLCQCAWVASSSLHGIILAHAYGIPAAWISYGALPSGDDTKFHDYFLSVGVPVPAPVPIFPAIKDGVALDSAFIRAACTFPTKLPDVEALFAACPFRTDP